MADKNKLKLHRIKVRGLYGFADQNDNIVIPCQWKDVEPFDEGLALVENDNDKWGYIDKTGKIVVPCIWKNIGPFDGGLELFHTMGRNQYLLKKD